MNKYIGIVSALLCLGFLTGCATPYPVGALFTEVKLPSAVTANNGETSKIGVSECESILTLIAIGDAGIEAAKKDAGITKVHHVDWEAKNILGIYGQYKTVVYGE